MELQHLLQNAVHGPGMNEPSKFKWPQNGAIPRAVQAIKYEPEAVSIHATDFCMEELDERLSHPVGSQQEGVRLESNGERS